MGHCSPFLWLYLQNIYIHERRDVTQFSCVFGWGGGEPVFSKLTSYLRYRNEIVTLPMLKFRWRGLWVVTVLLFSFFTGSSGKPRDRSASLETYQVRQELPVDSDLLGPQDLNLAEFKASEYFLRVPPFPVCLNFEAKQSVIMNYFNLRVFIVFQFIPY